MDFFGIAGVCFHKTGREQHFYELYGLEGMACFFSLFVCLFVLHIRITNTFSKRALRYTGNILSDKHVTTYLNLLISTGSADFLFLINIHKAIDVLRRNMVKADF